ncbi:MAG: fumarate/nitrate reduction transcriptional regulator Fnr [Gammaproteobacteria bacterium]|nr:fumarate/nitrate reduction transcriptional regulator Fnr [Gammaproteobacteria bacterium]
MNQVQLTKQLKVSCESCSLSDLCLPRGLNAKELDVLDDYIERPRNLAHNVQIYQPNDKFVGFYAVRSGGVKTYLTKKTGEQQILGFHLPGEVFGLDGLENSKQRCYATTMENTSYCILPYDQLDQLCEDMPELRHQVCHLLGHEMNCDHAHLLLLGQQTAHERLATFLLSISTRFKRRGFSPVSFMLPMSRHDIAGYLGIAVETVSRLFKSFQEKGIVKINRKQVDIIDIDKLNEMVANCEDSGQP